MVFFGVFFEHYVVLDAEVADVVFEVYGFGNDVNSDELGVAEDAESVFVGGGVFYGLLAVFDDLLLV